MIPPQALLKALVQRVLPQPGALSGPESDKALRAGPYGDLKVESAWPTDHLLADEGAYMVANMIPGATGLFNGLLGSYTAAAMSTVATVVLYNSASPNMGGGGPNLYPRFLRMVCAQVPTSGTELLYSIVIDSINRSPTNNGSPLGQTGPGSATAAYGYRVPVACTNMNVNPPIAGVAYFGNSTTAAAPMAVPAPSGQARVIVGNGTIKASPPTLLDQYTIQFGGVDRGGTVQAGAAIAKIVEHAPPVVIGPGQTMTVFVWSPANVGTGGNQWSDLALEWVER